MADNLISLVVGTRGTGKTDFLKNEVVNVSPIQRKLIVDTFDSPPWRNMKTWSNPNGEAVPVPVMELEDLPRWKSGLYRTFSSDTDYLFSMIEVHVLNTLLVFEDATKTFGSRLSISQRKFLLDSKQKNLNVVLVFHSIAAVPLELFRYADTLTLFKTNDFKQTFKKFNSEDILTISEALQKTSNRYENYTIRLN